MLGLKLIDIEKRATQFTSSQYLWGDTQTARVSHLAVNVTVEKVHYEI